MFLRNSLQTIQLGRVDMYFYRTPLHKQLQGITIQNLPAEGPITCIFGRVSMISAARTLCVTN
jgi:hypothetical protein